MTVSKEDFAAIQENDLYAGALMKFLKKGETPVQQKLAATLKKDNGNFFLGTDDGKKFCVVIDQSTNISCIKHLYIAVHYFSEKEERIKTSFLELSPITSATG